MLVASLVTATALLGVLGLLYVLPMLERKREVRRLDELCRRTRTLVLTYDDGPGSRLTPAIIEELQRSGGHATFFPLGRRAQAAPEVLDQVRRAGHEVGVHSHEHHNAWKVWPWTALRDALRGLETLRPWTPQSGTWYRPPHGKLDLLTRIALWRRRARIGWWTVDGGDTWPRLPEAAAIAESVIQREGGVVLLHDFDRDDTERDRFVLRLTQELLRRAGAAGLNVTTLGELKERERVSV